jgi:transposase
LLSAYSPLKSSNSIKKTREGFIISPLSHSDYLQKILGTDKRNPVFTIFCDEEEEQLHVYYGADLLEIVPDDREHIEYKLLVARLYNANLNATILQDVFQVDRKTMKRWGAALRSGDSEQLRKVLFGRQARRKLTPAIQSYIRMRFPAIYEETKYDYSKRMRDEIEQVFGHTLSGETLRPLLKELKESIKDRTELTISAILGLKQSQFQIPLFSLNESEFVDSSHRA